MDKLIFFDELVVPLDKLLWMQKKFGEWSIAVSTGSGVSRFEVTNESFANMKLRYTQKEELEKQEEQKEQKIRELQDRVKLLQTHISLMPGGTEYLLASEDFSKNI